MPPKKKRKPRARARAAQKGATRTPTARVEQEDPTEKRRERIQARREAKVREEAARRRRERVARLVRMGVLAVVAGLIVWFLFLRNQIPDAIAGNQIEDFDTFTAESSSNQLHVTTDVSYESTPPVSGEHDPNPAFCGVHGEPIRDENMVHTLEHGAVGIFYKPPDQDGGVTLDDIDEIERIVRSFPSHVFSAPFPDMETPVAMAAWAHLMRLDSFDDAAVREFIDAFRQGGDAPEDQDCPMGSDDSFEPAAPTPTPTPPQPTEDKGDKGDKKE